MIERIIRDDDETLLMFRRATVGKKGKRPKRDNSDIITNKDMPADGRGTSRAYVLDRLKRERPDLFELVVAKERRLAQDLAADPDVPPLVKHGEIGRGRDRGDDVTSIERSNSAAYIVRRARAMRLVGDGDRSQAQRTP